ncbi:ATP-binding cassette domain-containing protein [Peptoniphilus mikwangii]|uniref:ATP-binding cassette domain-containing protein n=1 Tax=Peptoniphilus mikwangii TaxID=1354300 RepID=UPI00040E8583|nr:ABC transporter ATP-binding protein [Peptoniphilus mikwangii]
MSAIVISELTKRMGKKRIFSDLNLEVIDGEFFALLGLEGSGKTTLSKILFNFLKPTKGKATIYDMDCVRDSKNIKESVSIIPEDIIFQENIKVSTMLKRTLSLHNLKNTDDIATLTEYFNLNSRLRLLEMNENEKKLFLIINALITKPRLLIIDEPSKYLNSNQVGKLFEYLNTLKVDEGLTVFILTQSLVEAQRYCDRAAYLYNGQIKEVEFLSDKIANDKIIKIYSPLNDLSPFVNIGAKIIKDENKDKILYYDKDMKILSRVIAESCIDNYSIENSSLYDKILAYFNEEA